MVTAIFGDFKLDDICNRFAAFVGGESQDLFRFPANRTRCLLSILAYDRFDYHGGLSKNSNLSAKLSLLVKKSLGTRNPVG